MNASTVLVNLDQLPQDTTEVFVMDQQLLTIDAVGQRLGMSRSAVYALVLKGEIPSLKIGRARRVTISAISAFIERKEQETSGNPNPPTPTKA